MSDASQLRESTTDLLLQIADSVETDISVGDLVDRVSDRGFGLVQLVMALPVCIPFLYGIPQVASIPMLFIALQIVAGRHSLWMPEKAREKRISKDALVTLAGRAKRYVGWFEAISRPRLTFLTRGVPERIFGLFMSVFCLSILVPLPATNSVPGLGVAIQSIGFLERDGLLVILGTIIGSIWVALLLFVGVEAADFIRQILHNLLGSGA